MKKRHLYLLWYGLPILLAATVAAFAVFAAAAGIAWLYIAGDNPWPPALDAGLVILFFLVFAIVTLALGRGAYSAGRRREGEASLDIRHPLAAAGATVLLLLAVAAYQWRVGNIGPKSDSVACSEWCQAQGFAGSGMPPRDTGERSCSCFDAQGREAARTTMDNVAPRR